MRRVVIFIASAFALFLFTGLALLWLLFRTPSPPQPKFGFKGNWRLPDVSGFEERQLPPARELWQDYTSWGDATTNKARRRLYLARLGGATNQLGFSSSISSGDTPMGAQQYTHVEFAYTDPTNGTYILSWMLRGKHSTTFLRIGATYRLYQLEPYGTLGSYPPRFSIVGIEGIKPTY